MGWWSSSEPVTSRILWVQPLSLSHLHPGMSLGQCEGLPLLHLGRRGLGAPSQYFGVGLALEAREYLVGCVCL